MSVEVLHVITDLDLGGAESSLTSLLRGGLADTGRHAVLSLKDRGYFADAIEAAGVPVSTLGMKSSLPGMSALIRLRAAVEASDPAVLQGWMYHGNLAASMATLLSGASRTVAWNVRQALYDIARERPLTRQVIRANRWLSRQPRMIIYNSSLSRSQHEAFGFSARHGRVVANGVDTQRFRPDAAQGRLTRRELDIPEEALVIGNVGRADPIKDHRLLLESFATLAQRHADLYLVLAGAGTDNDAWRSAVHESARQRLRLVGRHGAPEALMPAFDVYSSSSLAEGFPNAVAEAMACGVPCVATEVGDTGSIVGNCGKLVPAADRAALTAALEHLLLETPERRLSLGDAARRRICANFALGASVASYTDIYKSLGAT